MLLVLEAVLAGKQDIVQRRHANRLAAAVKELNLMIVAIRRMANRHHRLRGVRTLSKDQMIDRWVVLRAPGLLPVAVDTLLALDALN